jgi:hypothetical protein
MTMNVETHAAFLQSLRDLGYTAATDEGWWRLHDSLGLLVDQVNQHSLDRTETIATRRSMLLSTLTRSIEVISQNAVRTLCERELLSRLHDALEELDRDGTVRESIDAYLRRYHGIEADAAPKADEPIVIADFAEEVADTITPPGELQAKDSES